MDITDWKYALKGWITTCASVSGVIPHHTPLIPVLKAGSTGSLCTIL